MLRFCIHAIFVAEIIIGRIVNKILPALAKYRLWASNGKSDNKWEERIDLNTMFWKVGVNLWNYKQFLGTGLSQSSLTSRTDWFVSRREWRRRWKWKCFRSTSPMSGPATCLSTICPASKNGGIIWSSRGSLLSFWTLKLTIYLDLISSLSIIITKLHNKSLL
jgi:hypothetical protein